jgi:hypothetical protein
MTTELARPRNDGCLSDLAFDEWHAGELSRERLEAAAAHLAECPSCFERRAELDRARTDFLERFPVLPVRRARPFRAAWAGGALAAAAALVLVVSVLRAPAGTSESDTGTRSKGSRRLSFFVKHGETVTEGGPGQRVEPGDRLRFVLSSDRPGDFAILSLDGAGTASVYYPSGLTESRRFEALRAHALDDAIELDGVLGRERIFGVFCDSPFALEPLRRRLEAGRELVAPSGCAVDEIEIVKVAPR